MTEYLYETPIYRITKPQLDPNIKQFLNFSAFLSPDTAKRALNTELSKQKYLDFQKIFMNILADFELPIRQDVVKSPAGFFIMNGKGQKTLLLEGCRIFETQPPPYFVLKDKGLSKLRSRNAIRNDIVYNAFSVRNNAESTALIEMWKSWADFIV